MSLNTFPQQFCSGSYTDNPLLFSGRNNMAEEEEMALADRIRTVIAEMEGKEYGKQARLAKIAGCGRAVVNHWLSGVQGEISFDHANAIANQLGYRVEWLMQGKGPKKKGDPENSVSTGTLFLTHVTPEEMTLITLYRGATPMGKQMIEAMCRSAEQDPELGDRSE